MRLGQAGKRNDMLGSRLCEGAVCDRMVCGSLCMCKHVVCVKELYATKLLRKDVCERDVGKRVLCACASGVCVLTI